LTQAAGVKCEENEGGEFTKFYVEAMSHWAASNPP
jgi:hypothetical protein